MAQLLMVQGENRSTVDLRDDRVFTIGRARDADIHLDDPSLSRRHCEIRKQRNQWMLKDLGSFNGTFCNNLAVTEHKLQPGDQIQLGGTVLTFKLTDNEQRGAAPPLGKSDSAEADVEISRKLRNFMALIEISKALSGVLSRESLFALIIDKAIALCNADRGFLIQFNEGVAEFTVARNREGQEIADPQKQTSRAVIASMATNGEPVLTIDAQNDLSGLSQTIAALEIRSLLCAPLKIKDVVLGCIYVDSHMAEQEFGGEALNLLMAFADQASIAMENARLHTEVLQSREKEMRVRQMFQKYVPADVVRRALEMSDSKKMSSKQVATVLFSDIRGFTSLSERMEPEDVVMFLNDYLQRMVDIVFEEGGIVDKFIGDAVMAVFGAPFPKPDDAVRAVRAAHRMIAELERFNEDQAAKGGVFIRIGVGIHTGPVIAGNIGSDRKMEYTVIGDTVNIASRVQDLNKEFGTELIITQGCYDATRRRVPVRALPPVFVKGKELPLQVYELLNPMAVKAAAKPKATDSTVMRDVIAADAAMPDAGGLDAPTIARAPRRPPSE